MKTTPHQMKKSPKIKHLDQRTTKQTKSIEIDQDTSSWIT